MATHGAHAHDDLDNFAAHVEDREYDCKYWLLLRKCIVVTAIPHTVTKKRKLITLVFAIHFIILISTVTTKYNSFAHHNNHSIQAITIIVFQCKP